ncbi:lysozyme inhibitor LprI family protein [Xenophilus arseniciresistens]|uniref:Lysozyme inhibitor LprI family protein n=1 Tax=Xenophilus arseniciresistens TaxID=1283306 RepID=A0AAE3NCR5_9BURK|nr:lysozyme inhibitor LprI family protein [Xenophilus arseniciresistens]MDA7418421.1 lysozyme inhibitor LprI family protein [Xenophilus arseniciresistens]
MNIAATHPMLFASSETQEGQKLLLRFVARLSPRPVSRRAHRYLVVALLVFPLMAAAQAPASQAQQKKSAAAAAAMESAYDRLHTRIATGQEKAALEASQRAWLKDRDRACAGQESTCLAGLNIQRRNFLEGRSEDGRSAPSPIRPYFHHQPAIKGRAEITATLLKFEEPATQAQLALNAFMEEKFQEAVRHAGSTSAPAKDEQYYSTLEPSLNFVSSKIISATVKGNYYTGQAHPQSWRQSTHIEMQSGKILQFGDLLGTDNANTIFSYCRDRANSQKIKNWDGDANRGDVALSETADLTGDLRNWTFTAKKAIVTYGVNAFGGYGACNCICEIPYSILRPLAKKSFPLPK